MAAPENDPQAQGSIKSLDDLIVTYDMKKLLSDAKSEFESVVSTRELLGQQAIGSFFNLDLRDDARN
ncbi:hypothetical protein [Pelagicoccus sp. SDUM812005]|uniref:hypothetical protein n=1 Tax=Pelagicoccus sp. SDUM812005 TaxID=3041257 RepID=UPI00280D279B|nr:hypothetical protein [Pelagicoccus sp. SDUM812005]MDQ8180851.1 hypothetical protein [Pelagicoccus sp. SDUM812005]